jgi:hypothetical protein
MTSSATATSKIAAPNHSGAPELPFGTEFSYIQKATVEASAPPKPADSVFRAFAEPHFRKSRSWFRLESYLATNGGCYGIAGPRGVGKSWHMLLAVEWVREQGGIGVWFPSPSEYDPPLISFRSG